MSELRTDLPTDAVLDRDAALDRMRPIMGWFSEAEAQLLLDTAEDALRQTGEDCAVVEIGSYYGRSTVLLASAVRDLRPAARLVAIDPHDGLISMSGRADERGPSTYDAFCRCLRAAGVWDAVEVIRQRSAAVAWAEPIGLLFVDGLHDYDSVRADFEHFREWIVPGGFVAFHDYAPGFPGVTRFVEELRGGGEYRDQDRAGDLIVLRRRSLDSDGAREASGEMT
jgi:predicted O-methyltransferase YrrM